MDAEKGSGWLKWTTMMSSSFSGANTQPYGKAMSSCHGKRAGNEESKRACSFPCCLVHDTEFRFRMNHYCGLGLFRFKQLGIATGLNVPLLLGEVHAGSSSGKSQKGDMPLKWQRRPVQPFFLSPAWMGLVQRPSR